MADPVVHFEVIGKDPARLREYFGALFGWQFATDSPVASEVSDQGQYGFLDPIVTGGIAGGVGGGPGFANHTIFYVGVDDVEEALQKAEHLGGTRVGGPWANVGGGVVVGHFTDPEGNLIGVAGPR